jgi:hypothetical protein
MKNLLWVTALIVFIASPALAFEEVEIKVLLERCSVVSKFSGGKSSITQNETENILYCIGYINGFMGLYNSNVNTGNYKDIPFCLAPNTKWQKLARTFIDFSEKHPDLLNQPTGAFVTQALKDTFPCR